MNQEILYKLATEYATAGIVSKYSNEFQNLRQKELRRLKEQHKKDLEEGAKDQNAG